MPEKMSEKISEKMSAKIIVTRTLPAPVEERMQALFDVTLNQDDHAFSTEELTQAVQKADVLVSTISDKIDAALIEKAGAQLKLIANFGTGVDNIDVNAAHARGIVVTNTPDVLTQDTADLAFALLLALPRRLVEGDRLMRQKGRFDGWSPNWMLGRRLAGKKLGIIGMGRIGQAIAGRANVFGLEVHYHNRAALHEAVEKELAATYWAGLDAMLAQMDFLSVNCPYTPETKHLINAEKLALMKPEAYLVNTSRGQVVDEAALAAALAAGRLGGAGLDVFEKEPQAHPDLLALDNVILSPHLGSSTLETRIAMGEKVLVNIRAFIDDHTPPDKVLPNTAP